MTDIFIKPQPQVQHQDLTKRIVLIDTTQTVDPRLIRRRVILDSFDSDPLTKEQTYELYTELAEIESSLQYHPANEPDDEMEF